MGVTRPKYGEQTMDAETRKKLGSGFWEREHRPETYDIIWRCDLHKLNDAIRTILMDPKESRYFSQDPKHYLSMRFGEDTAKVYYTKTPNNDRHLMMREDPFRREVMAMYSGYTNGTSATTNTYTTTTTTGHYHLLRPSAAFEKGKARGLKAQPKGLVRRFPFVDGGDGLLKTLDREFDHWAGSIRRELFPKLPAA